MFETGRWRRYHSELAFLENIQEAKRAVQTWRAIATGGDVAAAAASVTSAFGWSPATMPRVFPREQQVQTVQPKTVQPKTLQPKAVHIAAETAVPVGLDPKPDVLAEVTEAPLVPTAPLATLPAPAAVASFVAPATVPPLKAPAARAPLTAPVVRPPSAVPVAMAPRSAPPVSLPFAEPAAAMAPVAAPPVKAPAAMAALLPQFAPPAAEIVAAPERVVEFTLSLDGIEAKYPLLRNAF
ncbi:putative repeat protein (TIGR03809 family) [Bradyrhizobium sacchari]|uniref:Putative repeat protein (TIGR03809 family) n=2 Tax=Bradyrhizobium sacchari TaxID=1399419 RepID=A0A560JPM2_9BRAD|nr:putative repeat protein (TIGR03809 family) [Bradyrhizobium sacchari]TWB71434.1 putative repeat protein (TIGR03809 family) [Bradyrhizobium sacchari]